jgi:hypothetical protein
VARVTCGFAIPAFSCSSFLLGSFLPKSNRNPRLHLLLLALQLHLNCTASTALLCLVWSVLTAHSVLSAARSPLYSTVSPASPYLSSYSVNSSSRLNLISNSPVPDISRRLAARPLHQHHSDHTDGLNDKRLQTIDLLTSRQLGPSEPVNAAPLHLHIPSISDKLCRCLARDTSTEYPGVPRKIYAHFILHAAQPLPYPHAASQSRDCGPTISPTHLHAEALTWSRCSPDTATLIPLDIGQDCGRSTSDLSADLNKEQPNRTNVHLAAAVICKLQHINLSVFVSESQGYVNI